MTTAQQQLATLSMARRAGRLVLGFERVVEQMKGGQLCGVYYTQDLSPKSLKELLFYAEQHKLQPMCLQLTMQDIRQGCGKRCGIAAVTDEGFASKMNSLID